MKTFGLSMALSVLCCLAINLNSYAANKILYENFDDKNFNNGTFGSISEEQGSGATWVSDGNGGYARSEYHAAGSSNQPSRLKFSPGKEWPTNLVFVRYKLRWVSYNSSSTGNQNIKIFRLLKDSNHYYWHHATAAGETPHYTMFNIYSHGTKNGDWAYPTLSNSSNGQWHTLAYLLNLTNGNGKFWFDKDPLKDSPTAEIQPPSFDWNDRNFSYFAVPADDGGLNDATYTRQYDDVEVWDGMPSSSSSSQSTSSTSSGSNNQPPPPGKPYVVN